MNSLLSAVVIQFIAQLKQLPASAPNLTPLPEELCKIIIRHWRRNPRIPCEPFRKPSGSAKHSVRNTGLENCFSVFLVSRNACSFAISSKP